MRYKHKKESRSIAQNISEYQKKCPQTELVYIKILREMTGERKLKTAFELYELARNLCRQSIIEQNPNISDTDLKRMLFKRFGYGAGRFTDKSFR